MKKDGMTNETTNNMASSVRNHPKDNAARRSRSPLWLYIHFPGLALECCSSYQGDLNQIEADAITADQLKPGFKAGFKTGFNDKDTPLVLVDQHNHIVMINATARALDLSLDMDLATAFCLCPSLIVKSYQAEREREALEKQALYASEVAAQIYLQNPRGLLIEAASMLRLHKSLEALWRACLALYKPQQLTVSIAVAHTPLAARLLAEHQLGRCRIDQRWEQEQIGELGIDTLVELDALEPAPAQRLQQMGIKTIRELQALPLAELGYRFGKGLIGSLQMLSKDTMNSAMTSNMQRYQRPQHFCQSVYFNHDIDRVDSLLFPLKRLLGELEHFLHLQQFDTTRLTLRLEHRKQDDTLWHFNSVLPSHQAAHFLQLIHIRFEQQTLPAPTIALSLSCDQLSPRQALADDLFIQQYQQSSGKLIDLLQSRLGQEALWSPGVNNDPRPEKAWCKCQPGKGQIGQRLAERPLWLQASPSPIDIRHYHILSSGERISAGWWQNTPVRRDYVSALHIGKDLRHQDKKQQQHTRHWLFRDDQGRYYLHGIFA